MSPRPRAPGADGGWLMAPVPLFPLSPAVALSLKVGAMATPSAKLLPASLGATASPTPVFCIKDSSLAAGELALPHAVIPISKTSASMRHKVCLLYTSDAADDLLCVD